MIFLQTQDVATTTHEFVNRGSRWIDKITEMAIEYAPKLLGALLIYIIGTFIIRGVVKVSRRLFSKRNFDISLQKFLLSLISVSLSILMFLTIVSVIGVDVTSFAAILAGAGIAIGAALNGSLGNLAGGVMLMIFKPFKVGDMIESQGQLGVVTEIGIFNTVLLSLENKTIILPNGGVSTNTVVNFNTHGSLRVDLTMGIALTTSIDEARKVATDAMLSHPKVLENPAPEVSVLKVGDGMVNLAIRPYTTQDDYWDVYFGVQELVKKAFDNNGIEGAMPIKVVVNK